MDLEEGRLSRQRPPLRAAAFLIAVDLVEKLANFVIIKNLIIYLTIGERQDFRTASKYSYFAEGITSILPLVGALVLGLRTERRFDITVISSIIYFMGLIILTVGEFNPKLKAQGVTYTLSAIMISLGIGGLKPCIDIITRNQFDEDYLLQINMWKLRINLLESLGIAVFTYVIDIWEWKYTYAVVSFFMIISTIIFICGDAVYQQVITESSDRDRNSPRTINFHMFVLLWLTCTMFGIFHVQTSTLFSAQSDSLTRVMENGPEFRPTTVYFVSLIGIKSLIFFVEKIVVPFFHGTTIKIQIFHRIIISMSLTILAMAVAVIVERKRLKTAIEFDSQGRTNLGRIPLSILWVLPQGILLTMADTCIFSGIEEYFTDHDTCIYNILQEYFSDHVRISSINLATVFYSSALGMGSFFSILLIEGLAQISRKFVGRRWIDKELNSSSIDTFYCLLTIISMFGLIAFVLIFRKVSRDALSQLRTDPIFRVDRT